MNDNLKISHRQALGNPDSPEGRERSIRMHMLYHATKELEHEHARKELAMIAEHTAKEKQLQDALQGIEDKHEAVITASDTLTTARQANKESKASGDATIISESDVALDVAKAAYDLAVQEFEQAEQAFSDILNDVSPNVYQNPPIG